MRELSLAFALIILLCVLTYSHATSICDTLDELRECVRIETGNIDGLSNAELCDRYTDVIDSCFNFTITEDCEDDVREITNPVIFSSVEFCIEEAKENCLSGDMLVLTNHGEKLVQDLKLGDMVSIGSENFEPVVWNSQHYQDGKRGNDHVRAAFIEFELDHGKKVTLTPSHYTKTTNGSILASNIEIGDTMFTDYQQVVRVVNINKFMKQGVYNPQTPSEQIVVNGVIVSTRSKNSPVATSILFKTLGYIQSIVPENTYSATIEFVSRYLYEPLYFGETSKNLTKAVLTFLGLAVTVKAKL